MQLPEVSIRRPVFATVLSLLIVLIGYVSFTRLSVREYPKIDEPVVNVETRFGGASSEVIESQISKVLEESKGWTLSPRSAGKSKARSPCVLRYRATPTLAPPMCATK
jgi:AcrB/AcrD/AcrF family